MVRYIFNLERRVLKSKKITKSVKNFICGNYTISGIEFRYVLFLLSLVFWQLLPKVWSVHMNYNLFLLPLLVLS